MRVPGEQRLPPRGLWPAAASPGNMLDMLTVGPSPDVESELRRLGPAGCFNKPWALRRTQSPLNPITPKGRPQHPCV